MAEHLSGDQVARYLKLELSREERSAAQQHLASCKACRELVSHAPALQAGFVRLRDALRSESAEGLTHLEYGQMEAYVDQTVSDADREIVESHIEICPVCRVELRDLEEFRGRLEFSRTADPYWLERVEVRSSAEMSRGPFALDDEAQTGEHDDPQPKVRRFRGFPVYIAGTAAAVLVLVVALWLVLVHKAPPPITAHSSPSVEAMPTNPALPEGAYSLSAGNDQHLQTPADLAALIGKTGMLLGLASSVASFSPLQPVGTYVRDVRPTFRWRPLEHATEYRVMVYDQALKGVETSPALTATVWTSSKVLERGKVYVWQVNAVRNGEEVVAPIPPAPEARFRVISKTQANELRHLQMVQSDPIAMGRAYARAGLLDEAETEFRNVAVKSSDYAMAQTLLSELRALRHP